MTLCSKCGINPRLSYHAYCGDCKKGYRHEHPEDRSKKYKRVSPFPAMCGKCKQERHAKGHAWCKKCRNQANLEWRQRHGGSLKCLTPRSRERVRIRNYLNTKVHRGQIQRLPCAVCGNPNSQAHHHHGYAKEHALDVVWLCYTHHLEAERKAKIS